jgi:hypothetical protein
MIRLRFRIRTTLFGVVALAVGFGAYRMMHDRFAYCRERAYYHEAGANTVDLQAKQLAQLCGTLGWPAWETVRSYKERAAEERAWASWFRTAAWRPWRRLPVESADNPRSMLANLRCPDDDTVVDGPGSLERFSFGGSGRGRGISSSDAGTVPAPFPAPIRSIENRSNIPRP